MLREERREVDTWTEMKRVMRKRYVPTSYNRTMRQKLQGLSQGNLTVEEYIYIYNNHNNKLKK